jgi:hypothetical protein
MARQAIRAVKAVGLSAIPSLTSPETNAATFKKGAPLIDTSGAGYLGIAGTDPRAIVGVATEPGHNSTSAGDDNVRFIPALPHIIFEGTLAQASDLGNYISLATDRWAEYGITVDSDGIWYLDKDKVTGGNNTVARIVGFKDAVGTVEARVYFIFLSEVTVYET